MEYYLKEIREETINKVAERNAGGKAREDVSAILDKMGIHNLDINLWEMNRKKANIFRRVTWHLETVWRLKDTLKDVKKGDILYLQFPIFEHSILQGFFFHFFKRNIKTVLIIHDLTMLRESRNTENILRKIRLWIEEMMVLKYSSRIIVHNNKMASYLKNMKIDESKLTVLQIFDYLMPAFNINDKRNRPAEKGSGVVIAGNLSKKKAGYVYDLPLTLQYNLYGTNFIGQLRENVNYCGCYKADELALFLNGSFGLVWDGPSVDSCIGSYGEYLKINNPHKTSLYLAAGIPVAIWNEAALADFITENRCGILIESLKDLEVQVERMSEESYLDYKKNAELVGKKIREGFYLQKAIQESRKLLA